VNELLARHETLEPSLAVVGQYLEAARGALKGLPESGGRAGLLGLAEFLAQQTDDLAVSI
jgi:geranylgeranyl pyrophosphate synthase